MTYYEILDIPVDASKEAIKKAYVQSIRIYSNENYPTEFQLLNKAYKTLSNEQSREEYNKTLARDPLYDELMEAAVSSFNNDRVTAALELFEEMDERYPNDEQVLVSKCRCYLELKMYREARALIEQSLSHVPDQVDWLELSVELHLLSDQNYEARKPITKLINLKEGEVRYHKWYAETFLSDSDFVSASRVVSDYFSSNQLTVESLHFYIYQIYFAGNTGNADLHDSVVDRIVSFAQEQGNEHRPVVIDMLINETEQLGPENYYFKDLIQLVERANAFEFSQVVDWISEARSRIRPNLYYYPEEIVHNDEIAAATASGETFSSDIETNEGNGSVFWSIVFGIILSMMFTPFIGIPAGFLWYFFASTIKVFLSGIGCVLFIILIIAFILSGGL